LAPLFEPLLLLEELLLFDEPPLREPPDDFELLPRDALLDFELLLLELLPRDALLPFEPLDLELLPRDAVDLDELLFELLLLEPPLLEPPREAPLLLLAPTRAATLRLTEETADFKPREADLPLLLFDEALPFEDDPLFFELPLLLLEPPLALRAGADDFFDDDPELFELFEDEALFFELPLLFLDDDEADFLEAIWFSFS
jgi:hypothetical protein